MMNKTTANRQAAARGARTPYEAPRAEAVKAAAERVMFTASPGVSQKPADPNVPIDSKGIDAFDYLPKEFNDPWE